MTARRDALLAVWRSSAQLLETTLALAGEAAVPVVQSDGRGWVEIRSSLVSPSPYWVGQPWEAIDLAVRLVRAALDAVEEAEEAEDRDEEEDGAE